MDRRTVLKHVISLPLIGHTLGAATIVSAQETWPTRTVTLVVPFPPGGQADAAARPMAAALEKAFGQPVIIENRAGAGGAIGNAAVARAEPDGHTLLVTLPSLLVLPEADRLFGRRPSYEVAQLEPVARILADPMVLVIPASAPWKSVEDLVTDAKKRPGMIPYGSSGLYGASHVAIEMFTDAASIKLQHVPYRGGAPALTGLLSGQVMLTGLAAGTIKPHVEAGTARILASCGPERISLIPDVPTLRELGYKDAVFVNWAGVFAPNGVPDARLKRIREAIGRAMRDPDVIEGFERLGSDPGYLDAPEFAKYVQEENARLITATRKIGKVE